NHYHGIDNVTFKGTMAQVHAFSHADGITLSDGKRPTAYFGLILENGSWRFAEYSFTLTVFH
ncbi:MAG: hypothetical protein KDB23_30170, partial [Planctomycetales bacterium]|nr:hypothetical protein [Planctomycetales bacterium]